MADTQIVNGRKFFVVKWLIAMFFYLSAAIIVLAFLQMDVPQSLGLALGVDIGAIAGYIGVNVWQKKIQGGASLTTETGGGNA
jgi:hypothetical protein